MCEDQSNEEKCFQAFQRVCAQHFVIDKVTFMKFPTIPVCRVRVEYKAERDDLPGEGDGLKALVKIILAESPRNCYVYDRSLIERKKIVVDYALLNCECNPPIFEIADVEHLHIC